MDEFVGVIKLFAGDYAPAGWKFCDGEILQVREYQVLFAILGRRYGGDGQSTFALPDLKGRVAVGMGQGVGLSPHTIGSTGGVEMVTLTTAQIPNHTHPLCALSGGLETNTPKNNFLPEYPSTTAKFYSTKDKPTDTLVPLNPESVVSVGGSQAHYNMQPFIALNYIICTNGMYPSPS